jgi:hypothetical protein
MEVVVSERTWRISKLPLITVRRKEVASKDYSGIAPEGVGRWPAAPQFSIIHNIIMEKGGGVQVLEDDGEGILVVALVV